MRARLVFIACAACLAALAPAIASSAKKPFRVASTLDGKTVLPHHIHWVALPTLPSYQIKEVDFLIDGKLRWFETKAPYTYSDDHGYLVTSWLTPGLHRFAVRAISSNGRRATDTVVARVLPAPEVPTELAGTWQRDLPNPVPPDRCAGCAPQPNPAGTYTLTFEKRWIQDHLPGTFNATNTLCYGCITDDDYAPGPSTFQVYGAVTTGLITDTNPEGGWWCLPYGPKATYSWSVSGNTLTLAPVGGQDPCHQRGTTWTGEWTKVG